MNVRLTTIVIATASILATGAAAQTWQEITPLAGPAPEPRQQTGAIYDPIAHAMVVFGGQTAGGRVNDIWAFDLGTNTWTDITPQSGGAPAGRITPATVYDPDNHTLLTFSGLGAGNAFFNDTWSFDLIANTWTEKTPLAPIPAIRYGVASCFDTVAKTMVTFAGFTFQGRFDDTWRFDPAADGWSDVSPVAGSPLERCLHGGCYDALGRRMIIYGGQNGGPLGDIWAFDLVTETWTELTPVSGPLPRYFTVFEYDANNHRATMFSGFRGASGLSNEVWLFNLTSNEWMQMNPAGTPPSERQGAAGIYIQSQDRLVIFGGDTGGGLYENDVWSLDDLSDTPTGVAPSIVRTILHQNHPNPFNPSTVIEFELAAEAKVLLAVYDVRGREVRRLHAGVTGAGPHSFVWDGRDDGGVAVGSGVYLYRLRAGDVEQSRKMLLLK